MMGEILWRSIMKKILALCVMAAFLAAGCGGEKKGEEKQGEEKKSEEKKSEEKAEAEKLDEKPAEEKPAKAPAAETGEAMWKKSCDHATKLILASPDMKDIPGEARADMEKHIPGECFAELEKAGGAAADESALCMLALHEFTPEAFRKCEPKRAEEPAPEIEVK